MFDHPLPSLQILSHILYWIRHCEDKDPTCSAAPCLLSSSSMFLAFYARKKISPNEIKLRSNNSKQPLLGESFRSRTPQFCAYRPIELFFSTSVQMKRLGLELGRTLIGCCLTLTFPTKAGQPGKSIITHGKNNFINQIAISYCYKIT